MIDEFFLIPRPKYIEVEKQSGLRLNKDLLIFVNKYKIRDISLLLSSTIRKHLGAFINTSPILDSFISKELGEKYFFAKLTLDIEEIIDKQLENIIEKGDNYLKSAKISDKSLLDQSYFISASQEALWIVSRTIGGYYLGIQTASQIIENCVFQHNSADEFITIPKMFIADYPDIQKRRTLEISKDKLENDIILESYIDFLGHYKFNVLNLDMDKIKQKLSNKIKSSTQFHQFIEIEKPNGDLKFLFPENIETIKNIDKLKHTLISEILWNKDKYLTEDNGGMSNINFFEILKNLENKGYINKSLSTIFFEMNINKAIFNLNLLLSNENIKKKLEILKKIKNETYDHKEIIKELMMELI